VGARFGNYDRNKTFPLFAVYIFKVVCYFLGSNPGNAAMDPIYTAANTTPAYQLNWGLTLFWREKSLPDEKWLEKLSTATEPDGVRILKHRETSGGSSQFFVSTKPHVDPSGIIRSVKGRLQNLLNAEVAKAFQRNYCIRSIGQATRTVVEEYVAGQLGHHQMAEPRVQEMLLKFQRSFDGIDLSQPSFSSHGQFWNNLHLVLVNDWRYAEINEQRLACLSDIIDCTAASHGDRLSRVGLLPDHIHLTMGCSMDRSPEEVALSYLNSCSAAYDMKPMFKFSYYVGTIGEYDRGAVS
jgi:REP element-mobilizing transposase RayT